MDCGFGGRFYKWVLSDNKQPYNSFGNGSAMRIGYVIDVAGSIAGQYYDIPDKVSEYNISKLSDDLKEIYINL